MPQDVLLFTRDTQQAIKEVEGVGGRVTHQFTDKVLVARLPDDADAGALKQSKTSPPSVLDGASRLAADAWRAKEGKRMARGAARGKGLPWDAPGFKPPDPPPREKSRAPLTGGAKKGALARVLGTPTSLYMEGSIAVGVVLVSGWQAATEMSADEQSKVVQEVQEGLDFLATVEPLANVSFVYDIKHVTVGVPPGPARSVAGNWPGFSAAGFATKVDAGIVWPGGTAYFFKGSKYIAYDMATDRVRDGFPRPIAGDWRGFPTAFNYGVDAALTWPNGKAYFFKGSKYISYDIAADTLSSGPNDIAGNWVGFPAAFAAGVDAAVLWNNGKAYFFKGDQYLRYDVAGNKTDAGYPKKIESANWPHVSPHFSTGLNAVLLWNDGNAYFFKGGYYSAYSVGASEFELTSDATEDVWRNAALKKMGFPDSDAGSAQYVQTLKTSKGTRWAYVIYCTKYPLYHYAYATGERIVMNYEGGGWVADDINSVVAHETCHVFGAADEYASSECACGTLFGHYNVPHYNCVNCPQTAVACVMKNNALEMCVWTRGQVGWNYGLTKIDAAVLWPNGKGYFFDGGRYSSYDSVTKTADAGFARSIAPNWPTFPATFASGIDAALVWNVGRAYFFKGSKYISYDIATKTVTSGPHSIAGNWVGFPAAFAAGVDAAVAWPGGGVYFFKGGQYLRYDIATNKVDSGPHGIAGNWVGFPADFAAGVDAAVVWNNKKAYFFKGDQYLRYDITTNRVDVNPQPILNNWPGLMKWKP